MYELADGFKEVARRPADNAPTDAGHHDSAEPGPAHPSVSDGTMMRSWLPGRLPWRGRLSDPYPAGASVPGVSSPLAFSALSRAGLLVLLSMALWLPMAPQAQAQTTVTLVSNTGQTAAAANTISSSFSFAQAFDTGSNPGGYNLDSIVVLLVAPTGSGTVTATVRADDSGTPSSTVLYTLTNPDTWARAQRIHRAGECHAECRGNLSCRACFQRKFRRPTMGSYSNQQWPGRRRVPWLGH